MIIMISMNDMQDGIGDGNGNLLFHLPRDMVHFKNVTKGNKVVMGRKTWDSLPKKPLKNRENYIMTRNKNFKTNKAKVINSIQEVLDMSKDNDVYIMGGGEIYNQFLPYADKMIITHVHEFNLRARIFFPDFSHKEWRIEEMTNVPETDKYPGFTFTTYIRK